jgi:hypothetical protein
MTAPRAAGLAGAGFVLRLLIAPSYGYGGVDGDLIEHKQALHVALEEGVHEIYRANARNDPALTGRSWEGGYFNNQPPLIHYLRLIAGWVYRIWSPAGFAQWPPELNYVEAERTDLRQRLAASRGFTVALKLPGILADALITLGLAAFAAARAGDRAGLLAASAYAFNPGIVFDTAYWGQHDAVAAALLVLGLLFLHRGRLEAAWVATALGGLSKPQALALWPLLFGLGWLRFPLRRVLLAALAAAAVVVLVFSPFIVGGTLRVTLDALVRSTFGGEAFVSCNANNLWWLLSGGRGYDVSDTVSLVGPFTARALGLVAFLGACGLVTLRLARRLDPDGTLGFLAAAVIGMSFFTLCTELHENHMMAVLPLLGFALPGSRRLWPVFAALSLTFLLNMALFETTVLEPWAAWLGRPVPVRALSLVVAAVNVGGFVALWAVFWSRTRRDLEPRPSRSA